MNHFTQITLLTFSLLCTFPALAQDNYIEVIVEESVELKVTDITYRIVIDEYATVEEVYGYDEYYEEWEEEDFDEEEFEEEEEIREVTLEDVKALLDREKFNYTLTPANPYGDSDEQAIITHVKSMEEFIRLQKELDEIPVAEGEIKAVDYESVDMYMEKIAPSLTQKARKKAGVLSQSAGKKLGNVLQIKQIEAPANLLEQMYGQFQYKALNSLWGSLMNNDISTKTVVVRYSYRFALTN